MKFDLKLENIKYANLIYHNDERKLIKIKFSIKSFDEKEILAFTKIIDDLEISTPQEVTINFACIDGLYNAKTKLIRMYKDTPYTFFYLNTPDEMEYKQNREYFRVESNYNCIYKVNINDQIEQIKATAYDISANGVCLILPRQIIPDSLSELTIIMGEKTITTKIRYIRSEQVNNVYRVSFTYVNISESDRDYISQMCLKKQLEERRNHLRKTNL